MGDLDGFGAIGFIVVPEFLNDGFVLGVVSPVVADVFAKLSEAGFIDSVSIEDAQLVIINTCSVRAKAEQKVQRPPRQ